MATGPLTWDEDPTALDGTPAWAVQDPEDRVLFFLHEADARTCHRDTFGSALYRVTDYAQGRHHVSWTFAAADSSRKYPRRVRGG
jgi:hypothetical protein